MLIGALTFFSVSGQTESDISPQEDSSAWGNLNTTSNAPTTAEADSAQNNSDDGHRSMDIASDGT